MRAIGLEKRDNRVERARCPWHGGGTTGKLGENHMFPKVGTVRGAQVHRENPERTMPRAWHETELTIRKGELMVVRRFVTLAVSFCLVLAIGITRVDQLFARGGQERRSATQGRDPRRRRPPRPTRPRPSQPRKTRRRKPEAPKATEPPLPPIPPEVQAKIDAARKAVAEAIVAAQDAGLVETSIDPPPILDILITGRATDTRALKNTTAKKPYAVSPEVFGAWFTGYGKLEGVNYADDVRIINPSAGLKQWYDQRARILEQYIQEIRKTKGPAPTPKKDEPSRRKPRRPKNRRRPKSPRRPTSPRRSKACRGTRIGGTTVDPGLGSSRVAIRRHRAGTVGSGCFVPPCSTESTSRRAANGGMLLETRPCAHQNGLSISRS